MLESTKDQILWVDILGQHVPPRIWYGTTCLLIRDDVESVPYSNEWEVAWSFAQAHMVQDGLWYLILPR
jgi:hypothetical protein